MSEACKKREEWLQKLEEGELLELKGAYEARARERYPLAVQFSYQQEGEAQDGENGVFQV